MRARRRGWRRREGDGGRAAGAPCGPVTVWKETMSTALTMSGGISWILIGLLAAALAVASVYDWRSRTIPNGLNAAIALLAVPFWWATGLPLWPDIALQVGVAALVFVVLL